MCVSVGGGNQEFAGGESSKLFGCSHIIFDTEFAGLLGLRP